MGLPERRSTTVPAPPRQGGPPAFNPNLILAIRFLVTALVCAFSLATTIVCILVVQYYNSNDPIVRPSWGTLIYVIVLGIATPLIYGGYNIVLPLAPFIRYGGFLYGLFMAKIELLLQFAMSVLWVTGALAFAVDLGGRENCVFDGYFHYPKPANFNHVCDLISYIVALAWTTFGIQVFLFAVELAFGLYTFLYLDQESLNEPHFSWGRRAYDYRTGAGQSGAASRGNAYRARAINADDEDTSSSNQHGGSGAGRRGADYNDPERGSEEMAESDSRPASLGARGRRGYDEETGNDDAYDGTANAAEGSKEAGNATDEGWHLREERSNA